MLTTETKAKLPQLQAGAAITLEAVGLHKSKKWVNVIDEISADMRKLEAAGVACDSEGTHMAAEVWILNTTFTPAAMAVIEQSLVSYELLPGRKSP